MKKALFVLAVVLLVLSLAQCSLFFTTVQYLVTSGDTEPMQILYQSGGEMTEVTANTYWTYEFDIFADDLPELGFIRVSKSSGAAFTVSIEENGVQVATDTRTPLDTIELYHVVE
jgi:hypothetical protein